MQTPRTIVQVPEPLRRLQIVRIERQGALEAGLRHVILPEHERGDAGAEAQARVARLYRRCLGECLERVAETPILDGCRARASECDRILRCARVSTVTGAASISTAGAIKNRIARHPAMVQDEHPENTRATICVLEGLSFRGSTKVALTGVVGAMTKSVRRVK